MNVNSLIAQAAEAADTEDQTVDTSGQFNDGPAPAGWTPARFIGYVEQGRRKQPDYQGAKKAPADEVRVYFELNGPKHQREVVIDGEARTFTNVISVRMTKKTGEKATFAKLLRKMSYGRDIKHIASMLGEGFLVKIVHNTKEKTDTRPATTYANMRDSEGTWLIGAPMVEDPMTNETKPVPVPEITQSIKLLLWGNPTQEQWDSIFIDGTRTVKDAKGVETEKSRNWLQEDIVQNALNYPGSPLEAMLGGIGDLTLSPDVPATAPETPQEAPPASPAPTTPADPTPAAVAPDAQPERTVQAAAQKPDVPEDDILAQLGLAA